MNGTYPKTMVNFEKIHNNPNLQELLKKFQSLLARNRQALDWKLFIYALAQHFKNRFDLRYLSNLAGIKIYRNYIQSSFEDIDDGDKIYNSIIQSLIFIQGYLKTNNITFKEYFNLDKETIPVALKHLYSGTVSMYFYAAFETYKIVAYMLDYSDDLFQEYFMMKKDEFIEKYILNKHKDILKYEKVKNLIEKIEKIVK